MVVQGAKEETMVKKTVRFGEQAAVPAIGLGTWYMGETRRSVSRRWLHCARASTMA
jgi:diketogulonate reductase-like aldo/keto reductase